MKKWLNELNKEMNEWMNEWMNGWTDGGRKGYINKESETWNFLKIKKSISMYYVNVDNEKERLKKEGRLVQKKKKKKKERKKEK